MDSNATVWVREHFATAPAIYGLVVFQVLVAAASDDPQNPALLVLLSAVLSFLGFYIAHVFAEVVARHGAVELALAVRHGFAHSSGMLYAAIPPALAIVIAAAVGSSGPDAAGWALLVGLLVLGFLGYQAIALRRRRTWARVLGGVATAGIGFLVILIEYAVH